MYDLIIQPRDEQTEWMAEDARQALREANLHLAGNVFVPESGDSSVIVDAGVLEEPTVALIAVRARENGQLQTIRTALELAFRLSERLDGVVIDMQLGGCIQPAEAPLVENHFIQERDQPQNEWMFHC